MNVFQMSKTVSFTRKSIRSTENKKVRCHLYRPKISYGILWFGGLETKYFFAAKSKSQRIPFDLTISKNRNNFINFDPQTKKYILSYGN